MDQNILAARHICPIASVKSFEADNKSGWRKEQNGDYSCTYCGSLHPEQFISFLDTVITDPDLLISAELNDRRNRVYINQPGVRNAGEGAIKFYLQHLLIYCKENKIDVETMDLKLQKALKISHNKFTANILKEK